MSKTDESPRPSRYRRSQRRFRTLASVLPRIAKKLNLEEAIRARPAFDCWPEIVGERVAQHTKPRYVERGTLLVVVDSPTWMTQLAFLKPEILRKIAARTGPGVITDIHFIPGTPAPGSA